MVYNLKLFQIFIVFNFFLIIHSQYALLKAKGINSYCEKNLYKIIIDIEIINPLNDYKSFYLNIISFKDLLFKCIIDPSKSQIICIGNLQQNKVTLYPNDSISLPYPFPDVDGIIWEYNSFLTLIYRRTIKISEECGDSVLKRNISHLSVSNWDLIVKINKIYEGQCLLSDTADNFYSFKMNLNILGGNLKSLLDSENKDNDNNNIQIHLMQNISMPFVIGPLQYLIKVNFMYKSHEYYKFAFCHPYEDITNKNYLNEEGIDFHCHIPISDNYIFNGPLKISTFSDNIFSKISSKNNDDKIDFISIYFTTEKNPILNGNLVPISSNDTDDEDFDEEEGGNNSLINNNVSKSSSGSNLRTLQLENIYIGQNKKKEYLLLDNRKTNFICPDKPVFEIENIQNGISYDPISDKEDKYNIILTGYLKNGYKVLNNKIMMLEYTPKEIQFNLSIIDNLVEESKERKKNVTCYLSSGTMFLNNEKAKIKCIGNKIEQKQFKNIDITMNWASKENKYLNDIVIHWPRDLIIHSKNIYSYKINALSIKKSDYDCYDNKYYFYVNILSMQSESELSFELIMANPLFTKAQCKLYTSNLLKCYLDLRLKKISKGTKIKLPTPGKYNITTIEGNFIDLTVLNFSDGNNTDFGDEGIVTDETCGNNKFVGAVEDIGYNHVSAVVIIISMMVIFFVILLTVMFCIVYNITHRNRKGKYFVHVEEKRNVNNSTLDQVNTNSSKIAH